MPLKRKLVPVLIEQVVTFLYMQMVKIDICSKALQQITAEKRLRN